jgi:predicted dehydrogenase
MTDRTCQPLRIGVLGAARIARLFVDAVKASPRIVIAAVASRDARRGAEFSRDLHIARVHDSYEALLADREIDAVYVPLPNSLHATWAIRAAESGKHVLCEKPLAATAAEARAMFDAAQRSGVYLVEGYPYRAQPQTLKLCDLLAERAIGQVQLIHASFGFPLADAANIRMDPSLAGGALMDAGAYPVSLCRMIVGTRPLRVSAVSRWAASGVDATTMATLEFPGPALAQISCSFSTARHRQALVVGDAGTIATTYFNDTSTAFPPLLEVRRGSGWDAVRETIETSATNGFLAEAEAFHDLVRGGWSKWRGTTPDESIDIALTLEAIAASARKATTIDVSAQEPV